MDYKRLILNRLLNKFERSKLYLGEGTLNRRVLLKMNKREFPEYDVEVSGIRELVNSIVKELSEKNILDFAWLKYEKNNIIEKVWLRVDNIEEAYREAVRTPKSVRADTILNLVRDYKEHVTAAWILSFLEDAEYCIESRKSLNPLLPDDEESARAVLDALRAINDKGDEECLERVFSIRCFGDSKYFERNVKKRIVSIVAKYFIPDSKGIESCSDDEILAHTGIVKSAEQIEFCGEVIGLLYDRPIDFSVFKYGSCINSQAAKDIEITALKSVKRVLFIENKANYSDYITKRRSEEELVVFHGGFYSPVKGLFLRKLYETGKRDKLEFYHWGDIDLGGFRIFSRLKSEIISELKPLKMDREAFLSKKEYWMRFDEKYGAALEEMLGKHEFLEFHDVIEIMLKEKARLEQEAFL